MQFPTHGVVKTSGNWDIPRVVMTLTPAKIPQHNHTHPEQANTDVWQVVRLFIDKNEFSSVTEKAGILAHYNNLLPKFSDFPTPEE